MKRKRAKFVEMNFRNSPPGLNRYKFSNPYFQFDYIPNEFTRMELETIKFNEEIEKENI